MVVMAEKLKELLERAQSWPQEAQDELVHVGLEIEEEYMRSKLAGGEEARDRAWSRLERLFARLRYLNPQSQRRSSDDIRKEEEEIAEDIRGMRRQRHD
jgi:hypothetical protein